MDVKHFRIPILCVMQSLQRMTRSRFKAFIYFDLELAFYKYEEWSKTIITTMRAALLAETASLAVVMMKKSIQNLKKYSSR